MDTYNGGTAMRRLLALVTVVGLLSAAAPTAARGRPGLKVTRGSMSAGGQITLSFDSINPSSGNSVSGWELKLQPTFDYFLADGFYLGGGIIIGGGFGDLYSGSTINVSPIQLNLGYVVPLRTILPYVSFGTGPMFTVPDQGDAAVSLSMSFGAGILVPLNYHVALQIGIHPTVLIGLSNFQGTIFSMPFGAIGIRGFF